MGLFDFLRRKRVIVNYNSSDLTESEKLSALANENAYLKGQMARIKADEAKKRETEQDQNEEEQVIEELNEQKKRLTSYHVNPFSITKLVKYIRLSRKRPKKYPPVALTTYDGKKVIGYVEDIVIMPDGGLGVVSGGKIIWASNDINHVFYWVNGLNNFAKNRIIPLCINSDGQFQPNLMSEEIEDITLTSDGKFKINKFNKRPLSEMVAGLHADNSELHNELKADEMIISEQQKEIKEKDREAELHKTRADKSESELSMALSRVSEIEKANGEILRQNTALMNMKDINEDLIGSMEAVVKKWGTKIEEELGSTSRDKEWENLKAKLNWAKSALPQIVYQMPEQEKTPTLSEQFKPQKP